MSNNILDSKNFMNPSYEKHKGFEKCYGPSMK